MRLWHSGHKVNLSLDSKLGEEEVHLKVGLGRIRPQPQQPFHLHGVVRVPGPS